MKITKLRAALIATLALTTVLAGTASAAPAKPEVKKGVVLGISSANIGGDDKVLGGISPTSRNHIAIGYMQLIEVDKDMSIRIDISLAQKGGNYLVNGDGFKVKTTYLQDDFMVQYRLPLGIKQPVNVLGGAFIAYNLLASGETIFGGSSSSSDAKDSTSSFDFGLVLGAGTVFEKKYTAEVRYDLGLLSFDKDGTLDWKNRGLMLTGGYLF